MKSSATFIQLRHYGSLKILEKDSKLLFFTNKNPGKFKHLTQWQSLPSFFATGKVSSFLSLEILKQKQFTKESHRQAESKQNEGTDSSHVSEVVEVESCIYFSKRNKTGCPFLYFTATNSNICSAPLAV